MIRFFIYYLRLFGSELLLLLLLTELGEAGIDESLLLCDVGDKGVVLLLLFAKLVVVE
jgi:hypothetical protein